VLLRRLMLSFLTLTGFLAIALFSRSGVFAESLIFDKPTIEDGIEEQGTWLLIVKSPDPVYVERGDSAFFSIIVWNLSPNFAIEDVQVEDVLSPSCNRPIGNLQPGKSDNYLCEHSNVQTAFTNTAVVTGINATNSQPDSASDSARVEVLELLTSIVPETNEVPYPGGKVVFNVSLENTSSVAITLNSITSPELGDLGDSNNLNVEDNDCPEKIGQSMDAEGGSVSCSFKANVMGAAGDKIFDITATGSVDSASISGSATAVVKIFKIISASLASHKSDYPQGSMATLTATVQNLSNTKSVKILTMEDSGLGDIQDDGNCQLPKTISPGGAYSCYYKQRIINGPGQQSFILDVTGETNDSPPRAVSDRAAVTINVYKPTVYLPYTINIERPTSCETALNIETNTPYYSKPNVNIEYYKFSLADSKAITVKIKNFVVKSEKGQVQVFRYVGEECSSNIQIVLYDETNNIDRTLGPKVLPPLAPGKYYYIAIVNTGITSVDEYYSLIVEAE